MPPQFIDTGPLEPPADLQVPLEKWHELKNSLIAGTHPHFAKLSSDHKLRFFKKKKNTKSSIDMYGIRVILDKPSNDGDKKNESETLWICINGNCGAEAGNAFYLHGSSTGNGTSHLSHVHKISSDRASKRAKTEGDFQYKSSHIHDCVHGAALQLTTSSPTESYQGNGTHSAFDVEGASFEIALSKESFQFQASHFLAYEGFREPIHGHNYRVRLRLIGQRKRKLGRDGHLMEHDHVQHVCQRICQQLHKQFLCPMLSKVLKISEQSVTNNISGSEHRQIILECVDGVVYQFPAQDCAKLPVALTTSDELAMYFWDELIKALGAEYLRKRGIRTLEVTVSDTPGQDAVFRCAVPMQGVAPPQHDHDQNHNSALDTFVTQDKPKPMSGSLNTLHSSSMTDFSRAAETLLDS